MRNNEPALTALELWELLRPFRLHAVLVMLLALADTVLTGVGIGAVFPFLQALLDPAHRSSTISRVFARFDSLSPDVRLLSLAVGTLAVFVAKAAVGWATVVSTHRLLQRLRFNWVDQIGSYYLRGPFRELAFRKQGELFNDWFNETLSGTRFFQSYLSYVSSLVLVAALVLLGFIVEWRLMVGLMMVGSLLAIVVRRSLYAQSSSLSARKLATNQALSATMVEDLASVREIKLMRAEGVRLEHLRSQSGRLSQIFQRSAQVGEAPRVVSEVLTVGLLMAAVVTGALVFKMATETMLPMLVFFSVAFYRLVSAVSLMAGARIKSLNEMQSLRRVRALAAKAVEQEDLVLGEALEAIDTDIRVRNLDYAYGETRVLTGVEVTIPRRRLTLLVGPSGAGKSTLLDLLLRLIDPQSGTIEANGRPASAYRLGDWRRAFGYVSQDVSLFNGTIRMNLLLSRPDATDAELIEACRLAKADAFVDALPERYDTPIGDRGYSLSGGQRKRIAIARALVGNPSVLILDEATTSFEQSLEHEVLRGIRAALPHLTIIQVTHRVQSLAEADWVIMLEAGRVVATGTPENVAGVSAPVVTGPGGIVIIRDSAIGVIPARGGSKSIPLKNLFPLAGRPMISYVITAGQAATSLAAVMCSTDDERISEACQNAGVEVLPRPASLAQDDSSVVDVLRDVLQTLGRRDGAIPGMVALLQPTSPFVLAEHIDRCVAALRTRPDADSAQTVVPVSHNAHAYNQRIIEHGTVRFRFLEERRAAYNKQRKPSYYLFGNVVVSRSASLLAGKDCFGDTSVPVEIPRAYALDVDTIDDVAYAEFLIRAKGIA